MMRHFPLLISLLLILTLASACEEEKPNRNPQISTLFVEWLGINPYTYTFEVIATDPDLDPLSYTWDFGNGEIRQGGRQETATFDPDASYTVSVTVSDDRGGSASESAAISTQTSEVSVDWGTSFQTIEGFGGFGAQNVYWSSGPFTSPGFVDLIVNDLGLTILRDNIPPSFEIQNDNDDPFLLDLDAFNLYDRYPGYDGPLGDHLQYLRDMKAAGVQTFIASIWSPPAWMKANNSHTGTISEAPDYNQTLNKLLPAYYEEFAEYCVAYVKMIKRECDIDVYALSIQNEPRFSQFYESCVYNPEAMRDVIKVVGRRFEAEGLQTQLFMPEDLGWFDRVQDLVTVTLADDSARNYADIIAVHGYALNGVDANSPDAATWQTMYGWGAPHGKPLWMTETSGFENNWDGALQLAQGMYTALRYGNISAWVYWSLSTETPGNYSLVGGGQPGKQFYASKQFYRYIRPGALRAACNATDSDVLPLAFQHPGNGSQTIVLINRAEIGKGIRLGGAGLAPEFGAFRSSQSENCVALPAVSADQVIFLPAKSIMTLYKEN